MKLKVAKEKKSFLQKMRQSLMPEHIATQYEEFGTDIHLCFCLEYTSRMIEGHLIQEIMDMKENDVLIRRVWEVIQIMAGLMGNVMSVMKNLRKYFYLFNQIGKLRVEEEVELDFKSKMETIKNAMAVEVERWNKRYTLVAELSKQKVDEQYFE